MEIKVTFQIDILYDKKKVRTSFQLSKCIFYYTHILVSSSNFRFFVVFYFADFLEISLYNSILVLNYTYPNSSQLLWNLYLNTLLWRLREPREESSPHRRALFFRSGSSCCWVFLLHVGKHRSNLVAAVYQAL